MDRTVGDLIDELSQHDRDAPARIAVQPSWPFEHEISGVVCVLDLDGKDVVYIGAGEQIGHLTRDAADLIPGF